MAFEGRLSKINRKMLLTRLTTVESLKITPDQIMDLDPYRDAGGVLHRTAPPHTVISIELAATASHLKDAEILNSFLSHNNRVKCQVEYWNPNTSSCASGAFYIVDVPYEFYMVNEEKNEILYKPIKVTSTEYQVVTIDARYSGEYKEFI